YPSLAVSLFEPITWHPKCSLNFGYKKSWACFAYFMNSWNKKIFTTICITFLIHGEITYGVGLNSPSLKSEFHFEQTIPMVVCLPAEAKPKLIRTRISWLPSSETEADE